MVVREFDSGRQVEMFCATTSTLRSLLHPPWCPYYRDIYVELKLIVQRHRNFCITITRKENLDIKSLNSLEVSIARSGEVAISKVVL